jgi:hypothetical protein
MAQVARDRLLADEELVGDLPVRLGLSDEREHLELACVR